MASIASVRSRLRLVDTLQLSFNLARVMFWNAGSKGTTLFA